MMNRIQTNAWFDTTPFTSLSVLKPIYAKINNMEYNLRTSIYQKRERRSSGPLGRTESQDGTHE